MAAASASASASNPASAPVTQAVSAAPSYGPSHYQSPMSSSARMLGYGQSYGFPQQVSGYDMQKTGYGEMVCFQIFNVLIIVYKKKLFCYAKALKQVSLVIFRIA